MKEQRVLVAYGSKHGATVGIAQEIGRALDADGIESEVRPAAEVADLSGYDAVILGSALYAGHWRRETLHWAHQHEEDLRRRPVWLFSSGPVDSSAEQREIPPVPQVAREMARLNAKGHVTFGGSITADTPGFVARTMVKHGKGGDFRSPEQIRRWTHGVAEELGRSS